MNLNEIYKLPPTKRIYNQEPYQKTQEATVLYTEDNIAIFDKTIFYAESGGQIYDIGIINGLHVTNVQKILGEYKVVKNPKCSNVPSVKINTRIIHTFDEKVTFSVGEKVVMQIDWERRYNIMKNHTLSHFLFYGITECFKEAGEDLFLKGCSINDTKATFSINNNIPNDIFEKIKNKVSSKIKPNGFIKMIPEPTNNEVFYWEFDGVIIPCGGTHVNNMNEISKYEIQKKSGGKGKSKISILLRE
ncbi:alanyl-tRNA editing protein [Xenorhabdus sp. TH1]|uniref:alanyl-tRNA editing protein n=1 Tax=Xenorhabdus sp. TH1 TaxID=3130166 RepID=UPI0030D5A756